MTEERGLLKPLKMQIQLQISMQMVVLCHQQALKMMLAELNINKEITCSILYKDLWNRKICAKFVS